MSDVSQGEGWWQASDGKWYPPEQRPAGSAETPAATESAGVTPPVSSDAPTSGAPDASSSAAAQSGSQRAADTPPVAPSAPDSTPPPAPSSSGGTPPPAPTTPPAAGTIPPDGDAGAPPADKGGKGKIIVALVAVVALVAGAFAIISLTGDDEAAADSVLLEPLGDAGPNPFSDPVAPEPGASLRAFAASLPTQLDDDADAGETPEGEAPDEDGPDEEGPDEEAPDDDDDGDAGGAEQYRTFDGAVPGLYGGTLDETSCDPDQLVAFLDAEEDKAAAFAEVLKIDPADIGAYVDGLTPVNLGADTRVLNHGFADGEATPREAVLQKGNAVLVDTRGVPRVSCYCGNPLAEPEISDTEDYDGDAWETFSPSEVAVVDDAESDLESLTLIDIDTGQLFDRPAGSRGDRDGGSRSPATSERLVDGPIELDTLYSDALEDDRTEARYTFDAPDGAMLSFGLRNDPESNGDVTANIEMAGENYLRAQFVSPGAEAEGLIILDHEGGGTFELTLTGGPAAYEFQINLTVQDDGGSGGDAGDDFGTGVEIESGQGVSGMLGDEDGRDVYLLELPEGGALFTMDVEVDREAAGDVSFEVAFDGDNIGAVRFLSPAGSDQIQALFAGEDEGTIEITAISNAPTTSVYTLTATLEAQADGGAAGDAGDALVDARDIDTGEELTGQIGDRDRSDWYRFDAPGAEITLTVANDVESGGDVSFRVTDDGGSVAQTVNFVSGGATETVTFEAEAGAEYRLEVTGSSIATYTWTIE